MIAQTSAEMVRQGGQITLFNSLKIRRYTSRPDIAALINTLGVTGLHVERWIPKAGFNGKLFDLRVLVIAGRVRHTVVRTGCSPLTNLHLGNARGDLEKLQRAVPAEHWRSAMESCERAATVFPNSLYAGIDLMFTPGFRSHCVIESNAFGDLLPNVFSNGRNTWQAELASMNQQATCDTRPLFTGVNDDG